MGEINTKLPIIDTNKVTTMRDFFRHRTIGVPYQAHATFKGMNASAFTQFRGGDAELPKGWYADGEVQVMWRD